MIREGLEVHPCPYCFKQVTYDPKQNSIYHEVPFCEAFASFVQKRAPKGEAEVVLINAQGGALNIGKVPLAHDLIKGR